MGQQQVGRLQVAMDHVLVMHVQNAGNQLAKKRFDLRFKQKNLYKIFGKILPIFFWKKKS